MFPIFLVFVPFILLHSLSLPMFLCSVFVVFWLFSFILVFSRHFKRVPCLFLAVHMSHFYVFSIFGIYTLILLGLLLSCPRFFRCVFPFFHYYLFLRFFVFAGGVGAPRGSLCFEPVVVVVVVVVVHGCCCCSWLLWILWMVLVLVVLVP